LPRLIRTRFEGLDRQFATDEADGFGNDLPGTELRLRDSCEHQPDSRINPSAMQFHDGLINLACEGLPLCSVNLPDVLPITLAKSMPEIREVFANPCPVATEPSDHFCARWRREFSQRFSERLTNAFTYSLAGLPLRDTSPAGSQLH